jgi:hypothetical protein
MNARIIGAVITGMVMIGSVAMAQQTTDPVFERWRDKVEPAIERGLKYLERVQRLDGSFPEQYGDSTGIPALVGMAFLSKGYLPTEGPYRETINRCIDFALANQKSTGVFEKGHAGNGPMYAHNITTLFLSEVSGMVDPGRQERIARALPEALSVILRAQEVPKKPQDQGGWRYHPNSKDSDTSCSGWALLALKSAKLNGAAVPDRAIAEAVAYLQRMQDPATGSFGYTKPGEHAHSLTGMGLLCLEICGQHGKPETMKAADFVMKNYREMPKTRFAIYGNYYTAQGMFQVGGRYWNDYANFMYETYLPQQLGDGSWESRETKSSVYGTSMMVLAFSVPWRQLPIYQRDETVDEK